MNRFRTKTRPREPDKGNRASMHRRRERKSSMSRRIVGAMMATVVSGMECVGQLPPEADPPYIPTSLAVLDVMLEMASVASGDTVYDLGSGDGRIVIRAAERGARGVGTEYDLELVERSRANADSAGVGESVEFVHGDVFEADVRSATVVTLYLGAEFNRRLRPRLLEQLRPGSRIVSHGFHMGDWEPDSVRNVGTGAARATLYAWVVPADVGGFWSIVIEGRETTVLEFDQSFQKIDGSLGRASRTVPIAAGEITGDSVEFEAVLAEGRGRGVFRFEGRLDGGRLAGVARGPDGGALAWHAVRFTDPSRSPEWRDAPDRFPPDGMP
ncbi:MAG: methyltransferase domain-containing protein [Gemmatimonas sp.]|nr:methyltransferase domain-containing protein [Gemmatimonas sp.]